MSFHLNWLAVETTEATILLKDLGWRETGWACDELRSRFACAVLPTGWTVIVSRDWELDLESSLPIASKLHPALGSEMSERVMAARLQAWKGGRRIWSVSHNGEKGLEHLSIKGAAPPQLATIQSQLRAQRMQDPDDDVDYMFDAPVELGESLCGYRPDVPLKVEWRTLQTATERAANVGRSHNLRDAIRSELTPLMQSLGWESGVTNPHGPGGLYDVESRSRGRLQTLQFDWMDDGREIYFRTAFVAFAGDARGGDVLVAGEVRPPPPRFLGRLAARLREFGDPPPPDHRLAEVIAQAHQDILAADRFLSEGLSSPSIRLRHGSAEAWRAVVTADSPMPE